MGFLILIMLTIFIRLIILFSYLLYTIDIIDYILVKDWQIKAAYFIMQLNKHGCLGALRCWTGTSYFWYGLGVTGGSSHPSNCSLMDLAVVQLHFSLGLTNFFHAQNSESCRILLLLCKSLKFNSINNFIGMIRLLFVIKLKKTQCNWIILNWRDNMNLKRSLLYVDQAAILVISCLDAISWLLKVL